MSERGRGRAWVSLGRIAVSIVLLWVVARRVDAGAVLARLMELRPGWVALALVVTVAQVLVLAWRWRLTAARLGLMLPFRAALDEYYLGIFLNQVLPGGVLGDVSRAWRHARESTATGPAVRAVLIERVSAQAVMTVVAGVCVLVLPWASASIRAAAAGGLVILLGLGSTVLAGWPAADTLSGRFVSDTRRSVLAPDALLPQVGSALAVVGSYILVYLMAARAVGAEAPLATTLPLVAPVLMTMLIPVTVAGWGIREAAAAWLWALAGLEPVEGAAISVAYGLIVLVSSMPGAVVLMRALPAGRGRRARPHPD